MSIDENKNENLVEEHVEEEQLHTEEVSEESVELDEESEAQPEEVTEMGHKKGEEEEEEHEDEEEEHESKVKEIAVPKTKAGVIQAAVEMLKKARKEDAQKLFAKMTKSL